MQHLYRHVEKKSHVNMEHLFLMWGEEEGQGDKEAEGSEEAVEGEEGDVLEGGEGTDDDEYEKAPPSPSAEDHDDGDSNLVDIGYLLN